MFALPTEKLGGWGLMPGGGFTHYLGKHHCMIFPDEMGIGCSEGEAPDPMGII